MPEKNKVATAASIAVAGLVVAGGATAAISASAQGSTPSNGSSYGAPAGYGQPGDGGQRGGGTHTTPTAAERTAVINAVKAKDSAVTVTVVQKDADGSFDAHGTKAGAQVMVEVSKDLKTITVNTGGGRGGRGPHGTPVTGTTLTNVTNAVKAKDSAVTVERVMLDGDGSYHAMGTKAGARVMVNVSKDLKTVTLTTAPDRGQRGQGQAPSGEQTPA